MTGLGPYLDAPTAGTHLRHLRTAPPKSATSPANATFSAFFLQWVVGYSPDLRMDNAGIIDHRVFRIDG